MTGRRFTSQEVCRLALVTASDLNRWERHRVLLPVNGLYSSGEAFLAMLYRELRERGFLLYDFRRVVGEIRKQRAQLPDPEKRWLLTNGTRVVFLAEEDTVLSFLSQRRNPAVVLIPLGPLAARIEAAPRRSKR